jgi:hypothetical protein
MSKGYKILLAVCAVILLIPTGCWLEHERAKGATIGMRDCLAKSIGGQSAEQLYAAVDPDPLAQAEFLNAAKLLRADPRPEGFAWLQAMRQLPSGRATVPWSEAELEKSGGSLRWEAIEYVLKANRANLDRILDAIALNGHWQSPMDFSSLQRSDFNRASRVRPWLVNATFLSLKRNDHATALTQLLASLRLLRMPDPQAGFGSESSMPIMWSALQSRGWSAVELEILDRELRMVSIADAESSRFHQLLAMLQWSFDMWRRPDASATLGGRRVSGISSWSDFWTTLPGNPKRAWAWLAQGTETRVYLWYDSYFDEQWILDEMRYDWDGWQLGIESGAMTNSFVYAETERKKHGPPPERLLFAHQSVFTTRGGQSVLLDILAQQMVRHRLVLTAVALARFHVAEGDYPDALDKLVPTFLDRIPSDPIDGQALRYRRLDAEEFELWSIGKDGIDNNGDGSIPPASGPPSGLPPQWQTAADWIWPRLADDVKINTGSKKEAVRP